jgi:indole-3-glycerol phosphate synthase
MIQAFTAMFRAVKIFVFRTQKLNDEKKARMTTFMAAKIVSKDKAESAKIFQDLHKILNRLKMAIEVKKASPTCSESRQAIDFCTFFHC